MSKLWALIAASAITLAACDVIRVPGGDHENQPRPVVPDGAPGPAPPTVPVTDPWGEETPSDIPVSDTSPDEDSNPSSGDQAPETGSLTDDPVNNEDVLIEPTDPDAIDPDIPDVPDPEPLPVKFEYFAPGDLLPGSGFGRFDETIYAPEMVFPIKSAPTFLNSQVYRFGGGVGGDQCDPSNYSMPWRDNFCETRTSNRTTPLCSLDKVHQGQDLRTGTANECLQMRAQTPRERGLHEAVAVEDGIIQYIGSYSLQLKGTETGFIYSYVHLNMRRLQVEALDTVKAGDVIGVVSNDFGGTPTTYHLHFEIKAPIEGEGIVHVPPYMSLVSAYERREGGIGKVVEDETIEVASAPVIVDPAWLID